MKTKKMIAIAAVCVLSAVAMVGCGGSSSNEETGDAPEKVVIGTQNLMNVEVIANAENYYAETFEDVEVEIKTFSAGKDLNQALAAGEIDFAIIGAAPVAVGLASQIDYKVLYSTAVLTDSEAMVAKADSGIKSVKDLEGKKVATTFTSTTHYSLLSALKEEGVDVSKVEILDMEPDKIVAAWQRGDIDAAYTWNPAMARMAEDNGNIVITSGEVGDMGYPVADFVVVRTEFADANPELVVNYMEAILKAEALYADDKAAADEIIAGAYEMTAEEVAALMIDNYVRGEDQLSDEYMSGDGFVDLICNISTFLADEEQIEAPLEKEFVKEKVDPSFLEQALEE